MQKESGRVHACTSTREKILSRRRDTECSYKSRNPAATSGTLTTSPDMTRVFHILPLCNQEMTQRFSLKVIENLIFIGLQYKFPFHSRLFFKPFFLTFVSPSFARTILKENENRQEVKRKINENGKTLLTYFVVQITEPSHNQIVCHMQVAACWYLEINHSLCCQPSTLCDVPSFP